MLLLIINHNAFMTQLFWEGGFGMSSLTITETDKIMSIDLETSWSFCNCSLNILFVFLLNPLIYLNFYLHASLTFPLLYVLFPFQG